MNSTLKSKQVYGIYNYVQKTVKTFEDKYTIFNLVAGNYTLITIYGLFVCLCFNYSNKLKYFRLHEENLLT